MQQYGKKKEQKKNVNNYKKIHIFEGINLILLYKIEEYDNRKNTPR